MSRKKISETSVGERVGHVLDTREIKDNFVSTTQDWLDLLATKVHSEIPVRKERGPEALMHGDGR
jgi:hypothetical protein